MQAANAAVSQSNRKINGQQVSSIASTADRPMHHRSGQQPAPLQPQPSLLAEVPARYSQAYTMSPDKMPPTCLHLPTVAHNLWAGQTTLAPTLPTAQVSLAASQCKLSVNAKLDGIHCTHMHDILPPASSQLKLPVHLKAPVSSHIVLPAWQGIMMKSFDRCVISLCADANSRTSIALSQQYLHALFLSMCCKSLSKTQSML